MENIYDLLGIESDSFRNLPLLANNIMDVETDRSLKRNIRKLEAIYEATPDDALRDIPKDVADQVLKKVIAVASEADAAPAVEWSIRELRIVSYYLKRLRNHPRSFYYALNILDTNWRDMFFNGLKSFLLSSWNEIDPDYRKATCRLLQKKLKQYGGNVRRYVLLQDHANLFDEAGPIRMAAIIGAKGMNLTEAPTLLGCKLSMFKSSYFSDVIICYVRKKGISDTSVIDNILRQHDLERTRKLLIADLVEQAEAGGDAVQRAMLCKYISGVLGDVTLASNWAPFPGATEEEAQRLRNAMEHAVLWLTQEVIETFFEVCVQDSARKSFWLNYLPYVSRFRIIGSSYIGGLLRNNSRVGSILHSYFIETLDRPLSQTSALVLFVRNKMIVEFSDVGALYVYGSDDEMVKSVLRGVRPHNVGNLKRSYMNALMDINEGWLHGSGRMVHSGNWQNRLGKWMEAMLFSNRKSPFSTVSEYDESFAGVPLAAEDDLEDLI